MKLTWLLIPIGVLAGATEASAQQPCDRLTATSLLHTTVTSAAVIAEGPYSAPPGPAPAPVQGVTVPGHCEVKGVIRPTKDSEIKFALWLPLTGWNGKYRQEGNGGWAGAINYGSLIDPLRRGYAVAATDDGHDRKADAGCAQLLLGADLAGDALCAG